MEEHAIVETNTYFSNLRRLSRWYLARGPGARRGAGAHTPSRVGCGRARRLLGVSVRTATTFLANPILTNEQGIRAEKLSAFHSFFTCRHFQRLRWGNRSRGHVTIEMRCLRAGCVGGAEEAWQVPRVLGGCQEDTSACPTPSHPLRHIPTSAFTFRPTFSL